MPHTYNILNHIPADVACLDDYSRYAREHLPDSFWHYINGAGADGISKQRNRQCFADIVLKPLVLSGVQLPDTTCSLFSQQPFKEHHSQPFMLAPVAYQKLCHPDGEIATAQAASAQDVAMVLSTLSSQPLKDVAAFKGAAAQWFQLYIQVEPSATFDLIKKAELAGYSALVITVDAPINGLRNAEQRSGFFLPEHISAINIADYQQPTAQSLAQCLAQAPSWQTIKEIKAQTKLPIILKGILSVADALKAQQLGVAGIVVSNHGGRVLDTVASPIEQIAAIRHAVGDDFTLLLDSGIRRGSDIFKALALGANSVLIGRPLMYSLASAGPLGVAHMIRILKDELAFTMAMCGCNNLAEITQDCLQNK
ncbi:alpha-hydroxy-acid oxidizing protein [Pseudoalteromonas sp. NEC-BIFX-2020_015]|uniref:alpha-hydroxy acid oxidase n=1 Tax=Pseudoalteromonas sp. NEC-BIFX-2020_015 TaxID=2729544 RepID=UPI001461349F|nr:alpha-hydroxy acid oxidase [Pseudoalteromonas sp. NEC-BIFX-2020_015]NMR25396.1 alpha-hydroxy-acid oxidizing protein [Pseudoalteromonas sp. NEC-BIFX-2020_015]